MHNHGKRHLNDKAKDFKASIFKLFSYNKRYIIYFILGLICAFATSILTLMGPDKLKDITNVITEGLLTGINLDKVKSIGLLLILLYSLSALFNFGEGIIMANITNNITKNMRSDISSKINRLPLSYFDKSTVGDTLSRMTNDIDMIGHTMNESFSTLIVSIQIAAFCICLFPFKTIAIFLYSP